MSGRESATPEVVRGVDDWNACYPIGTPVQYWPGERLGEGIKSTTRTPAWVNHGGNYGMVSVEDRAGGIILAHVEAIALPAGWRWDAPLGGVRSQQANLFSRDGALRGSIERSGDKGWKACGRYNGWFPAGEIADEAEARTAVERSVAQALAASR